MENKTEDDGLARNRIALVTGPAQITAKVAAGGKPPEPEPGGLAYLVEIRRGDAIKKVLVDSATGRILLA